DAHDAISQPFRIEVDLLALNDTKISFEKVIGASATVTIFSGYYKNTKFHWNGIVNRLAVGAGERTFTCFRAEIVPRLALLGKRSKSRIFQHVAVPDILKKVLEGIDVDFQLDGTFHPRDYCVQYGESDLAFASRLMEEEGIYYFFTHTEGSHKMMVRNTPLG